MRVAGRTRRASRLARNVEGLQCNIYHQPRTCLGKNDKFMFPRRPTPARFSPRFILLVIFIRGRKTQRKLDRNVFTTRLFIKPSTGKQIRSICTAPALVFAHLSLEIMLHKCCTHNTLVYFAYLRRFGFSITASPESIVNIRMRFSNGFVTRIYDTRSHVAIDLHKLREYCFNVNIRVMYIGEPDWEGVFVSVSYYLCGGRAPPLGRWRWRGIKSEREMIYPPITHRRRHSRLLAYWRRVHAHCSNTMLNRFATLSVILQFYYTTKLFVLLWKIWWTFNQSLFVFILTLLLKLTKKPLNKT